MSVYVDDMRAPFGRMVMCHMVADTHEELVAMAQRISLDPQWIQAEGTAREHFDVSVSRRARAIRAGAVQVGQREIIRIIQQKQAAAAERPTE